MGDMFLSVSLLRTFHPLGALAISESKGPPRSSLIGGDDADPYGLESGKSVALNLV